MENLLAKISKNVRAKTVLGRTINGDMFCSLLESYVEALNSGGAPEIKSAWARVVANQCSEARQQAISVYDQELLVALRTSAVGKVESDVGMDVLLPVTTQTLLGCHETAKMRSKEFFRSKVKNVILRNITIYL